MQSAGSTSPLSEAQVTEFTRAVIANPELVALQINAPLDEVNAVASGQQQLPLDWATQWYDNGYGAPADVPH